MPQKQVKSLERGLDILFLFTDRSSLTIDEISEATGLAKSTLYRFIKTFKDRGIIEVEGVTGRHRLGLRLLGLFQSIQRSLDIVDISLPYMQNLAELSGETIQLVALRNDVGICVEKIESSQALRVMPNKGNVIPLHAGASGRAIFAYLPAVEQERIIREKGLAKLTPNTFGDPVLLRENLRRVVVNGYATSSGEIIIGTNAIAAPIFDHTGRVTGSISVAGPRERFGQGKVEMIINPLLEYAANVSEKLGSPRPGFNTTEKKEAVYGHLREHEMAGSRKKDQEATRGVGPRRRH